MRPCFALPVSLVLLCVCTLSSQENPNTEISNHPYAAIDVGSVGTVGLQNGSLTVRLPILSFPERGKLGYSLRYFYDSKAWNIHEVCDLNNSHDDTDCRSTWEPNSRASLVIAQETSGMVPKALVKAGNPFLQFLDGDGGSHLAVRTGDALWVSADGTAATGSFPLTGTSTTPIAGFPRYAYNSSGTIVYLASDGSSRSQDANGNRITTSSGPSTIQLDTLNRSFSQNTPPTSPDPQCGPGSSSITNYPGPNSQVTQVKTCSNTISISSHFNDFDEYNNPIVEVSSGSAFVITSITVFDGNSWTTSPTWRLEYNTDYGDLTKITLPGGGSVSYAWANNSIPSGCATSVAGQPHVSRYLQSRTEDAGDGTGPQTTTYLYQQVPQNFVGGNPHYTAQSQTNVTNPLGDITVHEFSGIANSCTVAETEVRLTDHRTGAVIKTVDTDYMGVLDNGQASLQDVAVNMFPIRITTKLGDGSVSKEETDYDSALPAYANSYGKPVQRREYDFGHGTPGALLRCTTYDYLAFHEPIYASNSMFNLKSSETVFSGACTPANQVAKTTYGYDEYSTQASGVTMQLDSTVSGAAGVPRGNLTSVTRWMGNAAPLVSKTTYFDTGNPYQSTDASNHITTYAYSNDYFGAYRTKTIRPDTSSPSLAHHAVSGSYDLYTGQLTSFTDENGNTTTLSLDTLGRVYNIQYPPDGGSAQTTFDDDFLTVHQKRQMNSTSWSSVDTQYDGLGRLSRTATSNGGSGNAYNQADTCYDGAGRRLFQSYTYQGAGLAGEKVCSGKGDSFGYDALGRVLTVTHSDGSTATTAYDGPATDSVDEGSGASSHIERLSQSDALGRLVSVCEVTGQTLAGATPGDCGQSIAGTGFLTTYFYDALDNLKNVTQGSLAQRVFNYDPASRLTSSFNPETGTTSYTYNPDGTLQKKTRPVPNQGSSAALVDTNYSYDELQRLRTISYLRESSQTPDPYTPSVAMQYDETNLLGSSVTNASGKLTSELVSFPGQAGINAGRYFTNFDTMGRLKSELQCPPRTCLPSDGFDLQYGYDYVGNVTSIQNSLFGAQTNTYNIAGQLTSINHTLNGSTPVASKVTYGPFGMTNAALGNGLEEANTYDGRGRIKSRQLGNGQLTPSLEEKAAVGMVLVSGSDQVQESVQYPSGTITINGQDARVKAPDCPNNNNNCYEYDSGTVSVTVRGVTETYGYGQGDTGTTIASGLATLFNANQTPAYTAATISSSGPVLSIVGGLGVSNTQYPISAQVTYDTGDFSSPSFSAVPSGSALSGGGTLVYEDYGTAFVSINGHQDSVPFSYCDTAATITYALINAINADSGSPVTATAYNNAILLTDKQTGSVGNGYSIAAGETSQSNFTNYSFVLNTSGPTLEGGVDAGPAHQLAGPVYAFNLAYLPNGNIQSAQDNVNGNWSYTYDDMNRLYTAAGTGLTGASSQLSFQYLYDRFGNRLQQQLTSGTFYNPVPVTSSGANRIDGQCYDAAGNLLDETLNCARYVYDAENRLVGVSGGAVYAYDAEGRRVAKQSGPLGGANIDSNEYLLGAAGEQIAELDGGGNLLHTNVYGGGRLWSTYTGSAMHYHTTDWIGTRRIQTEANASLSLRCTELPFGDGLECTGSGADVTEQHFTGKERDTESGLDYFGARYYSSNMGRWMSPDWADKPEAVPYSSLDNPQSLNLYGYVGNNPLSKVDADGHDGSPVLDFLDTSISNVNAVAGPLVASATGALVTTTEVVVSTAFAPIVAIGGMLSASKPAGNYNDDHPNAQTRNGEAPSKNNPIIEPQTSSGGAMKGGGRNGQKVNADRAQSAKDKISDLKGQRDALSSKANKTPQDKADLKKLDNQIKQQTDRMKPSENHSQKGKGQQ